MKDAWFQFRLQVMDTETFSALKTGLQEVLKGIDELKQNGKIDVWASQFATNALEAFEVVGQGVLWLGRMFAGLQMVWNGLEIAFDGMILSITGS